MAAAERTDIHRPSFLDPAEYTEVGFVDNHPEGGGAWMNHEAIGDASEFPGNYTTRGRCDHCGAGPLRYAVIFKHAASNQTVAVGERCAGILNLSSRSERERRAMLEQAQRQAKREAWEAESFDNAEAAEFLREYIEAEGNYHDEWAAWNDRLDEAYAANGFERKGMQFSEPKPRHPFGGHDKFISDLSFKLNRYGYLTEKQVAAVLRSKARHMETLARREAEAAALEQAGPLAEGRYEIEGEVLSVKLKESDFGDTWKMLVKMDSGNKVYGTAPGNLIEQWLRMQDVTGDEKWTDVARGTRVRFTAAVERSRDDDHFGFYKRPTKAEVIETTTNDEGGE